MTASAVVLALAIAVCLYTYAGYPGVLKVLSMLVPRRARIGGSGRPAPRISIVLPVYNEAGVIAATLERLLAVDYPADRRQILVVSDASTDGTDEIVAGFAGRGVELLRLPRRAGKTAAENAARLHLTGEYVVNTDASVAIDAAAIRHLIAAFDDPTVGVASAQDVSVSSLAGGARANSGEGAYVGLEMRIRALETAVSGIVGASGCLYAIRADLHLHPVPDGLSRDFAAALTAREHGWRAVSVPQALCYVPRSASLRQEYRRKVRTMTRGLATLAHKRALLNPFRYGAFAWMLFSHKLCRWIVPWAALAILGVLAAWAFTSVVAAAVLAAGLMLVALGPIVSMPRLLALPGYVVAGNAAALHAWLRVLTGRHAPMWEPTRREAPASERRSARDA
jgi:cellulose synthase/poly-beta-1,6-N-acetylglucosamine synthase-like glycosyltransferase